jgi:hypothetical protein
MTSLIARSDSRSEPGGTRGPCRRRFAPLRTLVFLKAYAHRTAAPLRASRRERSRIAGTSAARRSRVAHSHDMRR